LEQDCSCANLYTNGLDEALHFFGFELEGINAERGVCSIITGYCY